MKSIPQVTLVAVDGTIDPKATIESLNRAKSQMYFGAVTFVGCNGHSNFVIPRIDKDGYNRFCLRHLWKVINTTHALTVQYDSGINNPDAWDDSWLEYDYIGTPWPPNHGGQTARVGNSGFCLRSRKLLEATARVVKDDRPFWVGRRMSGCLDDIVTCIMYRKQLEAIGIKFAPVEVAARFSFEMPTPEAKELTDQFGWHSGKRL